MPDSSELEPRQAAVILYSTGTEHYKILADTLPLIYCIISPDGAAQYLNQRWYEFTGATSVASLGLTWMDWLHPDDRARVCTSWMTATNGGERIEIQYRLRHSSGEYYWHLSQSQPVYDEAGHLLHWIGTVTDIHALKHAESKAKAAEEELRRSLARYKALIEASGQVVWSWDIATQNWLYADTSNWWQAITGQSPEEQQDGGWLKIVHPDDQSQIETAWQQAVKTGNGYNREYRVRNQQGGYDHIAERVVAISGSDGSVRELMGTLRNVTQQRQAEQEAQANLRLFQKIAEATPDILFLYDRLADKLLYVNQAITSLLGYTAEQIISFGSGMFARIFPTEDQLRIQLNRAQGYVPGEHEVVEHEYQFRHVDGGYRWFRTRTLVFSRNAEGEVHQLLGVAQDITELKHILGALQESHQRIRAILESIRDTFIVLDHDWSIVYTNQHTPRRIGITADEMIGHNLWELYPQLRATRFEEEACKVMREQTSSHFEMRGLIADAWFEVSLYPSAEGLVIYAVDISERKQMIEALRLSEERFARAFSASPDIMAISRQSDRILVEINKNWEKWFGYSREETIGRRSVDLGFFADPIERQQAIETLQRDGYLRDYTINLRDHWGNIHYAMATTEPIIINDEPHWLTIIRDLTERKQAEERLYQVIEAAPNGVALVDGAGRMQVVNKQVEQLFGYPRQELFGKEVEMLVPPIFRDKHSAHRLAFWAEPGPHITGGGRELFGMHKDGHTFPVEITLNPMQTLQGGMILCSIVDISERKAAEFQLRQSEERLRLAVELGRIGFFEHDFEANTSQLSPVAYTVTHYPDDGPITREAWLNYVHPEDRELIANLFRQSRLTGQPSRNQYRVVWPDQTVHWLQNSTITVKDHEGKPIRLMGAVHDITEHKANEANLRKLNQLLEQRVAERTAQYVAANKELEAFAYSVSHDLRAPLRAMSGFSEILLNEYAQELRDKPRHYLRRIQHNASQMGLLIDDLLTFSRLSRQPIIRQKVDLTGLVQQIMEDLSQEQGQREIEFSVSPLPTCQADPILLRQVMINLLTNALKYTRKRQQAHIQVGWQVGTPPGGEGEQTIYFVQDNGVGFDMRYADKLFQVFQRLHSNTEYEGTGIGLAIVQRIVHRHGGEVWAEAEVDKGATIYFYLASTMAGADARGD